MTNPVPSPRGDDAPPFAGNYAEYLLHLLACAPELCTPAERGEMLEEAFLLQWLAGLDG